MDPPVLSAPGGLFHIPNRLLSPGDERPLAATTETESHFQPAQHISDLWSVKGRSAEGRSRKARKREGTKTSGPSAEYGPSPKRKTAEAAASSYSTWILGGFYVFRV